MTTPRAHRHRRLPGRCELPGADPTTDIGALKYAMRSLGRRAELLRAEAKDLNAIIRNLIDDTAPETQSVPGPRRRGVDRSALNSRTASSLRLALAAL